METATLVDSRATFVRESELHGVRQITGGRRVPKVTQSQSQSVYSKPTMCLHCHLIVEMVHDRDADPVKGAWNCPRCGHIYPFQHWKIRKQTAPRKAEAA